MASLNPNATAFTPTPATSFLFWNATNAFQPFYYPPPPHYTTFVTDFPVVEMPPSLPIYMRGNSLYMGLPWQNPHAKIPFHDFYNHLLPTHQSLPFHEEVEELTDKKGGEAATAAAAEGDRDDDVDITQPRDVISITTMCSRYKGSRAQEKVWVRKTIRSVTEFGGSGKTTLMMRHIPVKYTKEMLLKFLDDHCIAENEKLTRKGQLKNNFMSAYDFLYLPIDFRTKCNKGYAFVNFTNVTGACRLRRVLDGYKWEILGSKKVCDITYARIQGREALKKHFELSSFICETEEYLPVFFNNYRDGSCGFKYYTVGKRIAPSERQQHKCI